MWTLLHTSEAHYCSLLPYLLTAHYSSRLLTLLTTAHTAQACGLWLLGSSSTCMCSAPRSSCALLSLLTTYLLLGYYSPPTVHYVLRTAYCILFTTYYVLRTTNYPLCGACSNLHMLCAAIVLPTICTKSSSLARSPRRHCSSSVVSILVIIVSLFALDCSAESSA